MDLEADNAPDIKYDAVFKAAQKCQLAFEKISRADREDHTAISLAQLFSANTTNSQSTSVITLNDVRDDFEQFRVWAKNLGVFAPGQASLDYRLRDATDLRDGFVLLLESLSTELMQCLSLLRSDCADHHVHGENEVESGSSDSDDSFVSDECVSSTVKRTTFELQARLRHVTNIVDKVVRLARVIRSSGDGSRATKAAAFVHFENGINMTEQFENHYLPETLRKRFDIKDEKEYLLDRLVQAVSLRRRRFMYSAKHQRVLAYGGELQNESPLVKSETEPRPVISQAVLVEVQPLLQQTRLDGPSFVSTPTKATTFQGVVPKLNVASRIVSSTSKASFDRVSVPPPPQVLARATHFECPYCHILISKKYLSSKLWRSHVIADLQPYVCLEPDCQTPNITLSSRKEWLEHQQWKHVMEWWCDGEYPCLSASKFTTMNAFAEHLKQVHNFSKAQLESKSFAAAGHPSPVAFSCCPFCDFTPSTNELLSDMASANACQRQLQDHVTEELLKIFLVALPDRDDLVDSNSDTDAPSNTRRTVKSLADISLAFADEHRTLSDKIENQDFSLINTPPNLDGQHSVPVCDPDTCDTTWQAVWASPELCNSIRKTYAGHNRDEILEHFINHSDPLLVSKPSLSDFRIAWISTSEHGFATAKSFVDEHYEIDWPKEIDTPESFVCGRMDLHSVIIIQASDLIPDTPRLKRLFPSVEIVLMVDTGYRIRPTECNIYLGDVVVGVSTKYPSGVTYFDVQSNSTRPAVQSWLSQPPARVLDALAKMRRAGEDEGFRIHQLLYKTQASSNASRPDDGSNINEGPQVHYGLIAVTNGLRHADADKIFESEEIKDVYCVSCPKLFVSLDSQFLFIQSIVNSYDGFGRGCEPYASATATAYARLLLNYIATSPSGESEALDRQYLLESLSVEEMTQHYDNICIAHPGTSAWFIFEITRFLNGQPKMYGGLTEVLSHEYILWLQGDEASGKSVLMKHACEYMKHANRHFGQSKAWTDIYFFFDACRKPQQNTLSAMLKSLIYQLLTTFVFLQDTFDWHDIIGDRLQGPTGGLSKLIELFNSVTWSLKDYRIFCFIDGIDKASETVDEHGSTLAHESVLNRIAFGPQCQACISISAKNYAILSYSNNRNFLSLSDHPGHTQDIKDYTHSLLAQDEPIRSEISTEIARRSYGNFLWAKAVIVLLNAWSESCASQGLLERLSRLPSNLASFTRHISSYPFSDEGEAAVMRLLVSHNCIKFTAGSQHSELADIFRNNNTRMLQILITDGDPAILPGDILRKLVIEWGAISKAVQQDDLDLVKALLDRGIIDPCTLDSTSESAVSAALEYRNASMLELLLSHATITTNDVKLYPPDLLQKTIRIGNPYVVELVLKNLYHLRGRRIECFDCPMKSRSPLRTAMKTDNVAIFELVLDQYDIEIDQPTVPFADTILTAAVDEGSLNIASLILERSSVETNAAEAMTGAIELFVSTADRYAVTLATLEDMLSRDGIDIETLAIESLPMLLQTVLQRSQPQLVLRHIVAECRAQGLVD